MSQRQALLKLIEDFNQEHLVNFFRKAHEDFKPARETFPEYVAEEPDFLDEVEQVGKIEFGHDERLLVSRARTTDDITKGTSKTRQYDLAKKILKSEFSDAGIFVFHDDHGHFRFSLVVTHFEGTKRTFTPFRRYTYYVSPDKANKTFLNQIGKADFSNLDNILKAFSIDAVSDDFYNDFQPKFQAIANATQGADVDQELKEDFALLFAIRIIFLGFVQKKKIEDNDNEKYWLGNDKAFLQHYWEEYKNGDFDDNTFYTKWLKPLFFKALNSKPGRHVSRQTGFSDDTRKALQMAPYLNGNLFKEKPKYDKIGLWIPDEEIEAFFEFLFRHNFTVEENTYYDQELELNPEFLGIIFEKLVNKEDGAVYTPRTEVDFMCRMGLVKWLQKNTSANTRDLYRLFFRERGRGNDYDEYQKQGDFSSNEISELVEKLENVTVCDPAAGSGAFEVGMLHVLQEILENLYARSNAPDDIKPKDGYELKKTIIARSLYGVEVKRWAVWINHLRLWLTLFIDMPDDERISMKPLLPSLNFKVRCGDSLVQRIGSKLFPVQGHADLSAKMKRKVTKLKNTKTAYFNNKGVSEDEVTHQEFKLFGDIIREELDEKRQELNRMEQQEKRAAQTQQGSLGAEFREPGNDQGDLEFNKADKDKLKEEIAELEEQENNLAEDHPLIWNIEFAEIFVEKGGFDVIIGNPPYVRQEDIADPYGNLNPDDYKDKLEAMVLMDYPDHFKGGVKISGRSDLYTYFYIRSLHLLDKDGVQVFICSNSWLDVGYGIWLQYFLLRNVPLHYVVDNHAKRSFASADVNTIITLFSAPDSSDNDLQNIARFVAFKRPFEEVILTENLLDIETAPETVANNSYRTFLVTKQRLLEEGSEFENPEDRKMGQGVYVGDKWGGKYLRAPDIFFTILDKGDGKFVNLKEVAEIKFGIKTGCNEFFYLTEDDVNKWKIEEEFLKPVIKSPRECKTTVLNGDDLQYHLFLCNRSKKELKGTKALEYIKWGERQEKVIKQGKNKGKIIKGFHNTSSLKSRKCWWDLGNWQPPTGILPCGFGSIFRFFLNQDKVLADKRMYLLYGDKRILNVMNSTIFTMFLELGSRTGLGDGLLDLAVYEFESIKYLPIESKLPVLDREIEDIFTECGIVPKSDVPISKQEPTPKSDRKELDDIIFDELNLSPEERKEVYRGTCQLVSDRVNKANSV